MSYSGKERVPDRNLPIFPCPCCGTPLSEEITADRDEVVDDLRETLRLIHAALPQWRTDIDVILEERAPGCRSAT